MGSRHPGRRRARSLRGGVSAQGLGPREGTGALQGDSGSDRRDPPFGQPSGDDTGCPRCSKEGTLLAGIAGGTFTSGPRPMSRVGQSPARSVTSRARSRRPRPKDVATADDWSFARATTERSVAERDAEGMAPRSGADHARDVGEGSARVGSSSSNADRGGSLARRRIGSSKNECARASTKTYGRSWRIGFQLHGNVMRSLLSGGAVGCGRELATRECLTRASR